MAKQKVKDLLQVHRDLASQLEKEVPKSPRSRGPDLRALLKERGERIERMKQRLQSVEEARQETLDSYDVTISALKADIASARKQLDADQQALQELTNKLRSGRTRKGSSKKK